MGKREKPKQCCVQVKHVHANVSELTVLMNVGIQSSRLRVCSSSERNFTVKVTRLCPTLRCSGLEGAARLLCPWNSPGENTGVGCHYLLQGIFPTQGSNLGLLRYGRQMLSCLSRQGSPERSFGVRFCAWSPGLVYTQ